MTKEHEQREAGRVAARAHVAGTPMNEAALLGMASAYVTIFMGKGASKTDPVWAAHTTIYDMVKAQAALASNQDITQAVLKGLFGQDGEGGIIHRFDISIATAKIIRQALEGFLAYERVKRKYTDLTDERILATWDDGSMVQELEKAAGAYIGMIPTRVNGERLPADLEQAAERFFNDSKYIWQVLMRNPGEGGKTRAGYFWTSSMQKLPAKFVVWGQNLYGLMVQSYYDSLPPNPTPAPIMQKSINVDHNPGQHPLGDKPSLNDAETLNNSIADAFEEALTRATAENFMITPMGVIDCLELAAKATKVALPTAARAIITKLKAIRDINPALPNVITGLRVLNDFLVFHHYAHGIATTADAPNLPTTIIQIAEHLAETMPHEAGLKNVVIVLNSVLMRMANEILTPNGPASPVAIAQAMENHKVADDIRQAITAAVANLVALPDRFAAKPLTPPVDFDSPAAAHQKHTPVGAAVFKAPTVPGKDEAGGTKPSAGGEYSRILKEDWKQATVLLAAFSSIIEQKPYLAATVNGTAFVLEALTTVAKLEVARGASEDSVARAIVGCVMDGIADVNMPIHPNYQPFLATPVAILVAYVNMNRYMNHDCVTNVEGAALYTELASVIRFIGTAYQSDEQLALLTKVFQVQDKGLRDKAYFSEISRNLWVNLAVVTTSAVYNHAQEAWKAVFEEKAAEPEVTEAPAEVLVDPALVPFPNVQPESFMDVVLRYAGPVLERTAAENQPRLVAAPELDAEGNLTNPGVVRDFRVMSEEGRRRFLEKLDLGQKAALALALMSDSEVRDADDEFIARAMLNRWKAEPATAGALNIEASPEQLGSTLFDKPPVSEDGIMVDSATASKLAFKTYDPAAAEKFGQEVFAKNVYGNDEPTKPFPEMVDVVAVLRIDMADTTKAIERDVLPASAPGVSWTPESVDFLHIEQWAQTTLREIPGFEANTLYSRSCNAILKDPTRTDHHVIATANRVNDTITVIVKLVSTDEYLRNDFPLLADDRKATPEPARQTLPGEVPSDLVSAEPVGESIVDQAMLQKFTNTGPLVYKRITTLSDGAVRKSEVFAFGESGWVADDTQVGHLVEWSNNLTAGAEVGRCNSTIPVTGGGIHSVTAMSWITVNEGHGSERVLEVRAVHGEENVDRSLPWLFLWSAAKAAAGDALVSKGENDETLVGNYAIQLGEGVVGAAILPQITVGGQVVGTSIPNHFPVINWVEKAFTADPKLLDAIETFALFSTEYGVTIPVQATASRDKGSTVVHITVTQIDNVPLEVPQVSEARVGQLRDALLVQAGLVDPTRAPHLANRGQEIRDAIAAQPAPTLADFAEELMHYLLKWVYEDRDAHGPKITRDLMTGLVERNRGVLAHLVPERNVRTLEWSVDTPLTHSTYDSITNAVNFAMSRVLGDRYVIGQTDWLCEYFRAGVAARSMEVTREKQEAAKA